MPPLRVYARKFCLDANLSYNVARALREVGYSVAHVAEVFPHPTRAGQCNATDEDLAVWAAENEHVLVTLDEDFTGKWARLGVLRDSGVETIVFDHDIAGAPEQLRVIINAIESWSSALATSPYQHRIWTQSKRGPIELRQGKRAKRKSREPNPPGSR